MTSKWHHFNKCTHAIILLNLCGGVWISIFNQPVENIYSISRNVIVVLIYFTWRLCCSQCLNKSLMLSGGYREDGFSNWLFWQLAILPLFKGIWQWHSLTLFGDWVNIIILLSSAAFRTWFSRKSVWKLQVLYVEFLNFELFYFHFCVCHLIKGTKY